MPKNLSGTPTQQIVAECEEALHEYAEDLGFVLSSAHLADTFMHKFEHLWSGGLIKYSDVLDHVKWRSIGQRGLRKPLAQEELPERLQQHFQAGDTVASLFCRVIEKGVLPLITRSAQEAGYDPDTVEGHQWVMSRFRKLGNQLFIDYWYRKASSTA